MKTKKIIAVLMILAMFSLAGCAANSWFCKNGPKVLDGLQLVIDQANNIISIVETSYPGVIPPFAQTVLAGAQAAKGLAQVAYAKACPTTEDLVKAQEQLTEVQMKMAIGVKSKLLKLEK